MNKLSKTYTFEAGHQLVGHNGKCARPHGHSYVVEVWIEGYLRNKPGASDEGMIMDYADLDEVVKPIVEIVDHRFMVEGNEPFYAALKWFSGMGNTSIDDWFAYIGELTTAENLAIWFWNRIAPKLPNNIEGLEVIIHETAKTTASYYHEIPY